MGERIKYSLWIRPFGDTAFRLQQRIKELGETYNAPVFEPHVTLLGGLERGKTELVQLTDTLAGSLHPFDITLDKAGYLDRFYQCLFIHAVKSEPLMNARKMAERLFGHEDPREFMPHLSLLYGDFSRDRKERILNTIGREFHITFNARNLLLINTTGKPGNWKKIHSAEFSGT